MEAQHPSHNASAEARLPHSATTTGVQQNLLHHNIPAGVLCINNKIELPNNPEVTDDNTEGTPSLSMQTSYLWFKRQNDLHAPSDPPDEPAMEED